MIVKATTISDYLSKYDDRTSVWLNQIYTTFKQALGRSFEEGMLYDMPSFYVSLLHYPKGYHAQPGTPLPFVSFAKQKNYISIYFLPLIADIDKQRKLETLYKKMTGRKLNHGKSCLMFKDEDHLPLDWLTLLVQSITREKWIEMYEQSRRVRGRKSQKT